ncbi:uncharacterized protein LOC135399775 [Ornithodoros turicata]|uniref:uncharacterized protein LOC135399775 n=1 Tax=Ornithodoros turicata TaxID=34597 RepID=UPI003138D664
MLIWFRCYRGTTSKPKRIRIEEMEQKEEQKEEKGAGPSLRGGEASKISSNSQPNLQATTSSAGPTAQASHDGAQETNSATQAATKSKKASKRKPKRKSRKGVNEPRTDSASQASAAVVGESATVPEQTVSEQIAPVVGIPDRSQPEQTVSDRFARSAGECISDRTVKGSVTADRTSTEQAVSAQLLAAPSSPGKLVPSEPASGTPTSRKPRKRKKLLSQAAGEKDVSSTFVGTLPEVEKHPRQTTSSQMVRNGNAVYESDLATTNYGDRASPKGEADEIKKDNAAASDNVTGSPQTLRDIPKETAETVLATEQHEEAAQVYTRRPYGKATVAIFSDPVFSWTQCLLLEACCILVIAFACIAFLVTQNTEEDDVPLFTKACKSPPCSGIIRILGEINDTSEACDDFYTSVCSRRDVTDALGSRLEAIRRTHVRVGDELQRVNVPLTNRSRVQRLAATYKSCFAYMSRTAELSFILVAAEVIKKISSQTSRKATREGILDIFCVDLFAEGTPQAVVRMDVNASTLHISPHHSLQRLLGVTSSEHLAQILSRLYEFNRLPRQDFVSAAGLDEVVAAELGKSSADGSMDTTIQKFISTMEQHTSRLQRCTAEVLSKRANVAVTVHNATIIRNVLQKITQSPIGGLYMYIVVSIRDVLPYFRERQTKMSPDESFTGEGVPRHGEVTFRMLLASQWRQPLQLFMQNSIGATSAHEQASGILQHVSRELLDAVHDLSWLTPSGIAAVTDRILSAKQPPPIEDITVTPYTPNRGFLLSDILSRRLSEQSVAPADCEISPHLIISAAHPRSTVCVTPSAVGPPFFYDDVPLVVNYAIFGSLVASELLFASFGGFNNMTKSHLEQRLECFRNQQWSRNEDVAEDRILPAVLLTVAMNAVYRGILKFRGDKNVNVFTGFDRAFFVTRCLTMCDNGGPWNLTIRDLCNVPTKNSKDFVHAFRCRPMDNMVHSGICSPH